LSQDANRTNRAGPTEERLTRGNGFTIRRGVQEDGRGVLACLRAAFDEYRHQYTPDAFTDTVPGLASLKNRLRTMWVYVAVSPRGKVIGTLAAAVTDNGEGHLRGMAVHPSFRNRGVARELLATVLNDLRANGCQRVTLDTTAPLTRAMHFYEANGFRRTGRVSDFFGMDLYEYARSLER
jgi:ribosomal protein S18 acetylase RimI-like enzyme